MAVKAATWVLCLRYNGTAELTDPSGAIAWASDSDDDFREEFSDEFLTEADLGEILDYLIDSGDLTESQADECECTEESLPGQTEGAGQPDDGIE